MSNPFFDRPTVRPANQRYPQPPFVFPMTPPSTAGLDTMLAQKEDDSVRDSLWTSNRSISNFQVRNRRLSGASKTQLDSIPQHRRFRSYSTASEQQNAIQDSDIGAFKVVIERPGTAESRPRTAGELEGVPTLEVPIPSYKLGRPHFSMRGTAFLRGSSYAGTEDNRFSFFTQKPDESFNMDLDVLDDNGNVLGLDPRVSGHVEEDESEDQPPSPFLTPPPPTKGTRRVYRPEMYAELTWPPDCDDPSLVRYAADGKTVTAATPARLIAEATQQMDYPLVEMIFITYRPYISAAEILDLIMTRLEFCFMLEDRDPWMAVRTFTLIRQWVVNFFEDDFLFDYDLRCQFCNLFNDIASRQAARRYHQVRSDIIKEVKKIWRFTCSEFWDGPEFGPDVPTDEPITPGGVVGWRDPKMEPQPWNEYYESLLTRLEDYDRWGANVTPSYNGSRESRQRMIENKAREQPGKELENKPDSSHSMTSVEAMSCSLPSKKTAQVGAAALMGAHPVAKTSPTYNTLPVAHTPKFVSKTSSHQRRELSDLFDDLMTREERDNHGISPAKNKLSKEPPVTVPKFAGSLIRGLLYAPTDSYVDNIQPLQAVDTGLADPAVRKSNPEGSRSMRDKIIGSVRRAVSTKADPGSKSSASTVSIPSGLTFGPDVLSQKAWNDFREISEAYQAQKREKNMFAQTPLQTLPATKYRPPSLASGRDYLRRSMDVSQLPAFAQFNYKLDERGDRSPKLPSRLAGRFDEVDEEEEFIAHESAVMSGALPMNPSTDGFTDAYLEASAAPTPPVTPPEQFLGSPRRSSHLLGNHGEGHLRSRSSSLDREPSLVLELRTSEIQRSHSFKPTRRPSLHSFARSHKSKSSSVRRVASYHSGLTRHMTERSFDATTMSGSGDQNSIVSTQQVMPARALRRRPGGDLRAATNIKDLPLRRSRSEQSLAYSDSVRSSYLLGESVGYVNVHPGDAEVSPMTPEDGRVFSLGALADGSNQRNLSLFSTRSSKPVMRPSFQAEAAKLAQIPDDVDDDGGVESALLKLEGKFEQRKSDISVAVSAAISKPRGSQDMAWFNVEGGTDVQNVDEDEKRRHRHNQVVDGYEARLSDASHHTDEDETFKQETLELPQLVRNSEVSVPILQRDNSEYSDHRQSRNWNHISILRGPSNERDADARRESKGSHASIDYVDDGENFNFGLEGNRLSPMRDTGVYHSSFLNVDDDDNRSDISSEISMEVISRTEYQGDANADTFPAIRPGAIITELAMPAALPRQLSAGDSMTLGDALNQPRLRPTVLPPTPDITPVHMQAKDGFHTRQAEDSATAKFRQHSFLLTSPKKAVDIHPEDHTPFIMQYPSRVLAEQFTLIEKDAINAIDFKELLAMKWSSAPPTFHSWPKFLIHLKTLEEDDPCSSHGVEICGARSSIMTQWAISQIVLTAAEARIRTIQKLLHIAVHSRAMGNYATMFQLVVALTSQAVLQLSSIPWSSLSRDDSTSLTALRHLISPAHNFGALREEMEYKLELRPVIPLVFIYAKDLTALKELPSYIAGSKTGPPLVNVGKCRRLAEVVKLFSRFLASANTAGGEVREEVMRRCLWVGGLEVGIGA
jgi:hypothetical protein